jgi:hypothetical protein
MRVACGGVRCELGQEEAMNVKAAPPEHVHHSSTTTEHKTISRFYIRLQVLDILSSDQTPRSSRKTTPDCNQMRMPQ